MKLFLLFLFIAQITIAQKAQISGNVKDKITGESVSFAHVYIANTTQGTTSEADGHYLLEDIPSGQFTLVCTMVGYESCIKNLNIFKGQQMELVIELTPSRKVLNEIEVQDREDKRWRKLFMRFKRELLGNLPNSEKCEIINPWVIDFEEQRLKNIFRARAQEPLIIHNKALGYNISFLLIRFEIVNDQLIYIGYPSFDTLGIKDWDHLENYILTRKDTYDGSMRHFFNALIYNKLEEEGFRLFKASRGYDTSWPDRLQGAVGYGYLQPVDITEIVRNANSAGNHTVYTDNFLEIVYTRKKWKYSPYLDAPYQVTRIKLNEALLVTPHGYVFNPYSYIVYGYLAEERVSNMLPYEYGKEKSDIPDR